jgi:hypothetical protein
LLPKFTTCTATARLVSLFAAAYAGTDEGVAAGGAVLQVRSRFLGLLIGFIG